VSSAAGRTFRVGLVLGGLAVSACAGFIGVFVSTHDQIKSPHDRHVKGQVDCTTCHESIFDSTTLTTVDLPKERKCLGCHREEKEKGNCAFCHTDPDHPLTLTGHPRELKMNHAEHIDRVKEDCTYCHKSLPNPLRTEGLTPKMETCLSCHEHQVQFDNGACDTCHLDLARYALKPLAAFSHRNDWLHDHSQEARSGAEVCGTCHEQSFCSECHAKTAGLRVDKLLPERVDRQFIHRNDFLSRHSVEASADEALCQRCHGTDFCQSCHARNGLVPGAANGLNPHPAGFGVGTAHGQAARADIVKCAACHDQGSASNCVNCHRVGGVGGNPHPTSWMLRHPSQEIGKNAMCQVCHH
jgi:hypothetical protein